MLILLQNLSTQNVAVEAYKVTGGGFWQPSSYKYKFKPEVVEIIAKIAQQTPKAPVTKLKKELKDQKIIYLKEYGEMLKAEIKAIIKAKLQEDDDEETLLMLF